jgi:hypothetical protein
VGEAEVKVQWLARDLMRNPLYVGLCTSEEAFQAELKRLKLPREDWPVWMRSKFADATAHYLEHGKTRRRLAIVCLRRRPGIKRVEIYGLLVHEAVHVWQWIKEELGEDRPSKEFEAYSIQGIAQNLMAAYG